MMVLQFTQNVYISPPTYNLYIFDPSIFFQFNVGVKFYFCYFLILDFRDE